MIIVSFGFPFLATDLDLSSLWPRSTMCYFLNGNENPVSTSDDCLKDKDNSSVYCHHNNHYMSNVQINSPVVALVVLS